MMRGQFAWNGQFPSEVTNIVACLMDFDHRVDVVGFEAGTLTQYLAPGLQSDGFDVVCLEARRVDAALSAMRNKTDRNDARGIAQILRTGWYSRVHVKSLASHYVRALLSSRKAVLKKCIDLENEVRGLFKVFGIKLPASLGHGPFDARVRAPIEKDPDLAEALLPLLDAAAGPLPHLSRVGPSCAADCPQRCGLSAADDSPRRWPGHGDDIQGRR